MADDGTTRGPDLPTVRTPAPGDRTVPTPPPPPPAPPSRAEGSGPPAGVAPAQGQDAEPDAGPDADPGPGPDVDPAGDQYTGAAATVPTVQPVGPAPAGERGPRRGHRRQTVTFVALLGAVMVLGLLAFAVFSGTLTWPFGGGATPSPSACATPASSIQAAGLTKVRVFNASTRRGLALATARDLQKRGFKVPEPPRNDTQTGKLTTAALLRHGTGGLIAARTVATQVKGPVAYQQDDRLGEVVDLVLSQTFALVDPTAGAAALKQKSPASPSCQAAPSP
jgi:hypothetical protein